MRILFCILLLSSVNIAHAQKIKELKGYDTLIHVFKLDNSQAEYVTQNKKIKDTSFLFTHLYKDYSRDKFKNDTLPDGNFIIVNITQNDVKYIFLQRSPVDITTRVIGEDVIVYLRLKKDKSLISKSKVKIDGKEISYDEGYGGYVFKKGNIDIQKYNNGKVYLSYNYLGESYYMQYILNKGYVGKNDNGWNYSDNGLIASPGYLLTDKPKYKPLDTLRLKAFLVKLYNGRPLRKKATLTIREDKQKFLFTKKIKSETPGAYMYEWPIPDTLKIDRNFKIELSYTKRQSLFYKSTYFQLEDYVLNKNTYDMQLDREIFFAGDDITFYVSARDANGFPIPNSMIHYNLKINELNHLLTDTIRITDEKMKNWYTKDTTIGYENFIQLKIPSEFLPKANAKYTLDVTITDPVSFERKVISKAFTKLVEKEKLVAYQALDSLHIRSLYNLKDTAKTYTLITLGNTDTISIKKIVTPYHSKLLQSETKAIIIDKDSNATQLEIVYNQIEITKLKGKRKHDSILISFKYPFPEPVHYKIFKDKQLVKSGQGTTLSYTVRDDSKSKYTILFTSDLHRKIASNFYRATYTPQENIIQINTDIKQNAFPGENIVVTINAKDYKNTPLSKVNITALAVNKMFENDIETPRIDVPFQYRNLVSIETEKTIDNARFEGFDIQDTYFLNTKHISKYNLLRNEYYRAKYPKRGFEIIEFSKQDLQPEFCVIISNGTKSYMPKYVLLDGEPVFYSDLKKIVYSFRAPEGKHSIQFRYFDRKYTLENISFQKSKKYIICINTDSLKNKNELVRISDSLSVFEPTPDELNMIYNSLLITNVFSYDSLKLYNNKLLSEEFYNNRNTPATLNIDGDRYYAFGPLKNSAENTLIVNNKPFNLKSSTKYVHFYDNVLDDFTTKNMAPVKGTIFSFTEPSLAMNQLAELIVTDTIVPIPEKVNAGFNKKAYEVQQEKVETDYYQEYSSDKGTGYFKIILENNNDSVYVKSMWLMHHTNTEICEYINNIPKKDKYTCTKQGSNALYDIYFLMNNEQLSVLKNIYCNTNDNLYINPLYLKKEALDNDKLAYPLKVYNELTKVPMLPFYFPPEEDNKTIKETKNNNRTNAYIYGTITDYSLSPLSNALVYVEINGRFKTGATTNENGEFELLDIPPGTYQVKIYHPEYQVVHYNPVFIKAGHEYNIHKSLNYLDITKPVFEAINNDFRFMTFVKKEQKNLMKISLYDKKTREPLQNVHIRLRDETNTEIQTSLLNKTHTEILFPKDKERRYTLEITKNGYTPLYINNVTFTFGYYDELYIFLQPDDGKSSIRKEYTLELDYELPDLEEKVVIENVTIGENEKSRGQPGEIYGKVTDANLLGLEFATIQAFSGGILKGGAKTDEHGNYSIKPLGAGTYIIKISYAGMISNEIENVPLGSNSRRKVDIRMEKNPAVNTMNEVVVRSRRYEKPLVETVTVTSAVGAAEVRMAPSMATSDYASVNGGVYQRKSGDEGISIGGDRSSNTVYMVDGMAVRGSNTGITLGYNGISAKYGNGAGGFEPVKYAEGTMIDEVMNNKDISTTRKKFSDVGYWKPNLVTDKKGFVTFTAKLPDNITTWKSYVVAMGKKWLHGVDSAETKVYKPLQTISVLPSFLYDRDRANARSRFVNLTRDSLNVDVSIMINNQLKKSKNVFIKQQYIDSVILAADTASSIEWKAGLVYKENYKDFEQLNIPVYSSAMKYFTNQSIHMEEDSTYSMRFANNTKGTVILNNSLYEKILNEIKELNNYEYGCVEQTASKLKALLYKDKINKQLQIKESVTKEINHMIAQLGNYQNLDGSFGWWRKGASHYRMSIYAMDVLYQANSLGYTNSNYLYARNFLSGNINNLGTSDLLYAYYIFKLMGYEHKAAYDNFRNVQPEKLSTTDKIYYYSLLKILNEPYTPNELYGVFLEMSNNLARPYYNDFFQDPKADIYNSYAIFQGTNLAEQWLKVFKKKLLNGQLESNLNTFSRAFMIEALCKYATLQNNKPVQATVKINNQEDIKTFPYQFDIKGTSYTFRHSGGPVFVNSSEQNWTYNPVKHDSIFEIKTKFTQTDNNSNIIKAGKPCILQADIKTFKTTEYVMIEIPIPAGMQVSKKESSLSGENYIEYYKHKIVMFFTKLPMGQKSVQFEMQPVHTGEFICPAAKASLMYYPFVYGNNENKMIEIR